MSSKKRHTVTAALPYANGPIHIGHLAGAYIPGDIYSRYLRLLNRDIIFICGSDEHGAAIPIRAKKEGLSPKKIIDKYHSEIKKSFEENINRVWVHTCSLDHKYALNNYIARGMKIFKTETIRI